MQPKPIRPTLSSQCGTQSVDGFVLLFWPFPGTGGLNWTKESSDKRIGVAKLSRPIFFGAELVRPFGLRPIVPKDRRRVPHAGDLLTSAAFLICTLPVHGLN